MTREEAEAMQGATRPSSAARAHIRTAEQHVKALFFHEDGRMREALAQDQGLILRCLNTPTCQASVALMWDACLRDDADGALGHARTWYRAMKAAMQGARSATTP